MNHISGIELPVITEPLRQALLGYQARSEDALSFELDAASRLQLTPDKPNAARSATTVHYLGEALGTLFVIAFRPGDGTGDESTYSLSNLNTGSHPVSAKVVPRSKHAVHTEAYLPLVSFAVDQPNADAVLYAGNQAKISVVGLRLVSLGDIGQPREKFQESMGGRRKAFPNFTLTTNYLESGDRVGDPHAIYNNHPEFMQICGFLALSQKDANPERLERFNSLLLKMRNTPAKLNEEGTNALG